MDGEFWSPFDAIIAWEEGELDDDGVVRLFQWFVDTGQAWIWPGHVGRTAVALIEQGLITPPAQG